MFGPLGLPEFLFILVLALLIFGPRKLPQIGRTIGKGLAEFRKASSDLKRTINAEMIEEELRDSDPRKTLREITGLAQDSGLLKGTGAPPATASHRPEPPSHPPSEKVVAPQPETSVPGADARD